MGRRRRAIDRARCGMGPSLLECKTFRMTGHSAHDDAHYVPRELWNEWLKQDPIARLSLRGPAADGPPRRAAGPSDPRPAPGFWRTGVFTASSAPATTAG